MIYAVIPAAGTSSRMGRPKLALPLGGKSVLQRAVAAFRDAGIEHVVVVIGPHVSELASLARCAGAHVCLLAEPTAHMRDTIVHGLAWLEEQFHPHPDDAWLLLPGDHPLVEAGIVRQLVDAHARLPQWPIVVPTCSGKRGHPLLIAWNRVAAIRELPADQGLNHYLRTQEGQILEVPVASAGILADMDMPADYERLQQTAEEA
jgi:CTP:molybdopterin cytidylyltransferase MocA